MKTYIQYKCILIISAVSILLACTPEADVIGEPQTIDIAQISRIELKPSNIFLIANGKATLNLTPIVYIKSKINENKGKEVRLPESRIKEEWFEFKSSSGLDLKRKFSTSDASLIGKTIDAKLILKGTNIESNIAKFTIIDDISDSGHKKEITFPIVFHVIQQNNEDEITGLMYDKELFYNILDKFNNTFSGINSINAVGVDTHIRFKPALYAPTGEKLPEAGIHRITVDELGDPEADVVTNNLIWNPKQYLNIWLVSGLNDNGPGFAMRFLSKCKPSYKYPTSENAPQGIELDDYTDNSTFSIYNAGIMYKLQDIGAISRSYSIYYGYLPGTNELVHYLGYYFGLLPNNIFKLPMPGEDFCDDTVGYFISSDFYLKNESAYKETPECFFLSENIMDDPTGFHNSISKAQSKRIHWILQNCPERSAWKSPFAFTGK